MNTMNTNFTVINTTASTAANMTASNTRKLPTRNNIHHAVRKYAKSTTTIELQKAKVEKMTMYRAKGYTNEEIAHIMNTCHATVVKHIGRQPHYMTCRSQYIAQNHRWETNRAELRHQLHVARTELAVTKSNLLSCKNRLHEATNQLELIKNIVKP